MIVDPNPSQDPGPIGSHPTSVLPEEVLDHLADAVIVRSPAGDVTFWNAAAERLYGWTRSEAAGNDADALLNSRPTFGRGLLDDHEVNSMDVARVTSTRRNIIVDAQFRAKRNAAGDVLYVVETTRDVTAERAASRAMQAADTRYRNLFHAMAAAFFEIDITPCLEILAEITATADGDVRTHILSRPHLHRRLIEAARIVEVNDRVSEIFGFPHGERPASLTAIWSDQSNPVFVDTLLARAKGVPRLTSEVLLTTSTGDDLHGVFTACLAPASIGEGRVVLGIVDTTELKLANAAVERSREHHRALFDHMPIGLCRINGDALTALYRDHGISADMDLRAFFDDNPDFVIKVSELCLIEEANPQAAAILGARNPEELAGMPISFAWQARRDTLERVVMAGIQRTNCEFETQLNTLDGRLVDVIFSCATIQEDGRRLSVIGLVDIGDRKAAQEAFGQLQAEFAHSSRISLLGELSASIAHEISQPLVAIAATGSTGLRWLDHDEPRVDQARSALNRIVGYAQRANGIITRVRQLASGRPPRMTPVPLAEVVGAALQLIEPQARSKQIELQLRSSAVDDLVNVDRTQIEQVVVNLVVNAIQAISEAETKGGRVEIDVSRVDGRTVCTIADTGPGIADDRLHVVFDRFVTSKAEGTGLGLALCRSIIQAHRGEITVAGTSALGGAEFKFFLPHAAA